jgi:hypothetical protein
MWFPNLKALRIWHTAKLGPHNRIASFIGDWFIEFIERFCHWWKTAIILMFSSAVSLFILPLKLKIDHHREKLYLLCRWTKGLCENIGNGIIYTVIMTVGVRIFSGEHFYLVYYYMYYRC